MTPPDLDRTRRHLFSACGVGLGKIALASLLGEQAQAGEHPNPRSATEPLAPRPPHFPGKAKSVIYLFMAGGPSQLELFDWKPKLQQLDGQLVPESFVAGKRFAFMDSSFKGRPTLLGTRRKFRQHGGAGAWVSDLLPHFAQITDRVCLLRAVTTDVFNHAPAKLFCNTGSAQFGRPSLGAWVTYGLGSASRDLPGFVVLHSGPRGPRGGSPLWGSGFLPTAYQGVPLRNGGDPILALRSPRGICGARQADAVAAINDLNRTQQAATGDPEIATRIAAYEMAFRMQASAPELVDVRRESAETLALYGAEPGRPSFAMNCLLARRLVERGVRCVQLYHTDWDHHGGPGTDLGSSLEKICREVDRPMTALLRDLARAGLLDSTVVVWGGEFGRTPMGEPRETIGRNHHIESGAMWLAGAGIKAGHVHGATDELGFAAVEGRVHMHDVQATLLHLLGLDHKRLTYRFQGRDFRLTDVAGELIRGVLA
jgi:hypothetical protein